MPKLNRPTLCEPPDLLDSVRRLLDLVPSGQVTTFGDLAGGLGDPAAAIWIGKLIAEPHRSRTATTAGAATTAIQTKADWPLPADRWPVHRIVLHNGELPGYGERPLSTRADQLQSEGVPLLGSRVDFRHMVRCQPRLPEAPLVPLQRWQTEVARQVVQRGPRRLPRRVAALDVSYPQPDLASAAYVEWDCQAREIVWSATACVPVTFPFITGYLGFRELPALLAVLKVAEQAGRDPLPLIVDGAGQLHPRRCGLAVMLGVVTNRVAFGVTKHRPAGFRDDGDGRLVDRSGKVVGHTWSLANGQNNDLSVGHRISLETLHMWWPQLAEPGHQAAVIVAADRLSRTAGRALTQASLLKHL